MVSATSVSPTANYLKALYTFDAVVQRAEPSRWDDPSPCEGWMARDVVNHMVFMVEMVRGMAQGRPAAVPGSKGFPAPGVARHVMRDELLQLAVAPPIGATDDPAEVWGDYRDGVVESLLDPARLAAPSLSLWGHATTESFLGMAGGDAAVHTWDLAKALGQDPIVEARLAEDALRAWSDAEANGVPVRQRSILDEPVATTAADPLSRLVAYAGRHPE